MKTIDAYCSACDNQVRLVLTDEPIQDDPSPIHDREVVCLEIGEHCSGNLCPIGAVPPVVMGCRRAFSRSSRRNVRHATTTSILSS